MSSESPVVVLFDMLGNEMPVQNGVAIPTTTPMLLVGGSDGTNSRYFTVDTSGRLVMVGAGTAGSPVGGIISIQGVSGGTALPVSGTVTVNQGTANSLANAWTTELTDGSHGPAAVKAASTAAVATDPALVVAISPNNTIATSNLSVGATGATPPTDATYMGASVTTAAPTYTTGQMDPLSLTTGGLLRIDGVYPVNATTPTTDITFVGGAVTTSAPTYTTGQLSAFSLDTSGNLRVVGSFNNASVGSTAAAPPSSATYMGALVTTAAESGLTTGDMYPLNLTTTGQLRIDSAYPLTTAVATAVDMTQVGGVVTTANPTYTTATVNALSLDTSGNLRVTGSFTSTAADITATGALGAVNAAVSVTHPGLQSVGMQLAAGTLIGTIVCEVSFDGGTTWNQTFFDNPTTGNMVASIVFGSANTATAESIVGAGGAGQTRVRVSAYTSGTANVTVRASDINDPSLLSGGAAGAVLPPVIQQIGASVTAAAPVYTTATLNALSMTTAGQLRIDGVSATGAAAGADAMYVAGAVTTAAPTYTTGQMDPLSLTTAGLLRVDGVYPLAATTPTTDVTFVGGAVTTGAPTYTTGQLDALSINTTGDLRVVGKVTDGTNIAAVKAASTAAVATDPALVVAISPNNVVTTSVLNSYGTNNQTITITLASLASSAQRQSTVVSNTTNLFIDALVQLTIKTGASGVAATGIVNVYAFGTSDGGTTYGENAGSTDAAITLTVPPNLKLIGTINAVANATVYKSNPLSVSAAFNGRLPASWGIVVENKTSATFDTTAGNFKVAYQGVSL
jgi:hypothetical protein